MQSMCRQFKQRGLIYQQTHVDIPDGVDGAAAYCGFDPSASSLHLGNLMAVMMLVRVQAHGYTPIALVGGATGMIGDPSGKSTERQQQAQSAIEQNTVSITKQLSTIFKNCNAQVRILNNLDFYRDMSAIRFLSEVGTQFRVSALLQRELVQSRLSSTEGISYTEFSYGLLQAYDFSQLHKLHDCVLQFGGSDQWGNIVGGCDYVRRSGGKQVYGFTSPLLVDSNNRKFGKSEGNALFLDPSLTSRETMTQYLLNQPDDMIESLLLKLTLAQDVPSVMEQHTKEPHLRIAQRRLSQEIQRTIYGDTQANSQEVLHSLNWEEFIKATPEEVYNTLGGLTSIQVQRHLLDTMTFTQLLIHTKVLSSKSEARRLIESGGVYVSNKRISEPHHLSSHLLGDKFLVIRIGKKDFKIIEVV